MRKTIAALMAAVLLGATFLGYAQYSGPVTEFFATKQFTGSPNLGAKVDEPTWYVSKLNGSFTDKIVYTGEFVNIDSLKGGFFIVHINSYIGGVHKAAVVNFSWRLHGPGSQPIVAWTDTVNFDHEYWIPPRPIGTSNPFSSDSLFRMELTNDVQTAGEEMIISYSHFISLAAASTGALRVVIEEVPNSEALLVRGSTPWADTLAGVFTDTLYSDPVSGAFGKYLVTMAGSDTGAVGISVGRQIKSNDIGAWIGSPTTNVSIIDTVVLGPVRRGIEDNPPAGDSVRWVFISISTATSVLQDAQVIPIR